MSCLVDPPIPPCTQSGSRAGRDRRVYQAALDQVLRGRLDPTDTASAVPVGAERETVLDLGATLPALLAACLVGVADPVAPMRGAEDVPCVDPSILGVGLCIEPFLC